MNKIKINSFEINSYRSCIQTKLVLHSELTALIGLNGAGKSNILNALLFLTKITKRSTTIIYSSSGHKDDDNSNKQCKIKVELTYKRKKINLRAAVNYVTDEQNYDTVNSAKVEVNYKEVTGRNVWLELVDYPNHYYFGDKEYKYRLKYHSKFWVSSSVGPSTMSDSDLKAIEEDGKIHHDIISFISNISYYSASQFSDPSQCPVAIELGENRITRKTGTNKRHENFILDLYKSFKLKNSQYKKYLSIVNKESIGLLDNIGFIEVKMPSSSYKIKDGINVKTIHRNRILIVPVFTLDNNKLSPNQLSEGTFKTLALLFYLLTDENKFLLIEEPEVCVHQGLLNNIIALIKQEAKTKQIIVSTHSDYVLDQLKPENVIMVRKQSNQGTEATQLTKAISKNDYKLLKDYLKNSGNLGEYLKEGGV